MSFYSKQQRFVRRTYSITASNALAGGSVSPPSGGLPEYVAVSGTWFFNGKRHPRTLNFDVREYGRLLDVRVWVECLHAARSDNGIGIRGLGNFSIALRSPNVKFTFGHPLWNAPDAPADNFRTFITPGPDAALIDADIYRNSYVLWDGTSGGVGNDEFPGSGDPNFGVQYNNNTWDSDIDMRTVFTDGSRNRNTRHIELLYPQANDDSPGPTTGSQIGVSGDPDNVFPREMTGSAPWAVITALDGYPFKTSFNGSYVSWIYDRRISNNSITGSTNFTGSLGLSPPIGWLTGPGGTANANEFPTTGSQIGPPDMLPVYPLLDDVVVKQITLPQDTRYDEIFGNKKLKGFRPGLRGTEVNGRWQLMFGMASGSDLSTSCPIWFRQARLELLFDTGYGTSLFNTSTDRKYKKTANVLSLDGPRRKHIIFGSARWDDRVDYVVITQVPEHGRTVGITSNTGSAPDAFSVFSQVTGTFTDELGSDQLENIRRDFLRNEFGTPFIPLSSGSGISPSFEPFSAQDSRDSRRTFNNVLRPFSKFMGATTLKSSLGRANFFKTRAGQLVTELELSSSL